MKNIFRFLMSAAILFGAVSCAKEDISSSLAGGEVEVTLSVDVPELGTRAFGDGMTVNQLFIAVYEKIGNTTSTEALPISRIDGEGFQGSVAFSGGRATVTMVLLKGKTYDLVFWAQNRAQDCYSMNWATRQLTVDYTDALSQEESRDAFFLIRNDWTAGAQDAETEFHLYRPFAQINVANSDADVAFVTANGATIEKSAMTVKTKVANVLNMKTGDVAGSADVDFDPYAIPSQAFHIAGYNYLAMNYLLVNEKDLVNLEFVFTDDEGVAYTREYGNVPVQRNYRTNILGQIISSPIDFTVVIENIFNNVEHEVDNNGTKEVAVVDSVDDLATIAEQINNGELPANTNIVLNGDIDLSATRSAVSSNWTPIGTSEQPFTGTFDGKGFTIKNLTLVEEEAKEGKAYIGFFGYAEDATIKNITFENVYINIPCLDIDHSQGHIGAVAGSLEGTSTIENVTVEGLIQVYATQDANGASRVAVVAGGNTYGNVTMKNVHVDASEGSYLIANNNTGALAGQLQGKSVFENCSSNIDVKVNKFFAGGIIGLAAGDQLFVDCHTTGNISVLAGRNGKAHDHYRVGGIAGGWADGKKNVCTLVNCSYEGTLTGVNSDGSVAEKFDYFGYVGRGYTLNGCQGSKVVIDGVEFVQKFDTADKAGIYTINGCTPVSTADELVAALEANEGVYLLNDIKINPAAMSNAYGTTGINIKNGQTIDGGGHTLNIQGAGGTWDSGINTTGGIIRNITVTGSFRGIFINHTSTYSEKVVLENVTLTGVVYTISCDQGLYQGIEATNCTFNGWTSFAKTAGEAKFVNCLFGEGNGYKYCRPYSNTEFVGCTFCPGYSVDQTRATVTFTDCTWEE